MSRDRGSVVVESKVTEVELAMVIPNVNPQTWTCSRSTVVVYLVEVAMVAEVWRQSIATQKVAGKH